MLPQSLPQPDLLPPGGGEPSLRWGIIGAGWIAGRFADAIASHTEQRIVAVATRTQSTAEAFARTHGIDHAYGSASALLADPDIDVVYIATQQSMHLPVGLEAIGANKHVLIEKPIATSADEARELVAHAKDNNVLLMEAMWSRYMPQAHAVRALLADGILGDVRSVFADHGQAMDPDNRLRQGGRGGGALLDFGIYSVQLSSMALGPATTVAAFGTRTEFGADATSTLLLGHAGGGVSTITTSLDTQTPSTAAINGSLARIEFAGPFYMPMGFSVRSTDWWEPPLVWSDESGVTVFDALSWQATALARYVSEGRTESPLHTHAEMISILQTIDEARLHLGSFE